MQAQLYSTALAALELVRASSVLEKIGAAASLGAGYYLIQAIRIWWSDADLELVAAQKRMPKNAFSGQTVLITGASSGIGEALAYELASRGSELILTARRVELMRQMIDRCHELGAPAVEVYRLDVTDFASHEAIIDVIWRKHPRISYLVNNAGRSQRGLAESTPLAVDKEMIDLNVLGSMSVTKAVLPRLLKQGCGTITFTSSVAGKVGSPISATYAATKHALQGWADSLRMEVEHRGVKVVSVCPGPVQSEITLRAFTDKQGVSLGIKEDGSSRMSAQRCAALYAAAMWAGLPEVWLAPQPILLFVYLGQYFRSMYFWIGPSRIGPARVAGFLKGQTGYASIANLGNVLASKKAE